MPAESPDPDAGLESLSEIEGFEFLSDLDAGFEEELRHLGVDPAGPTAAKPGSEEKVMMLAARYAAGLPLWHQDDCYDHGPGSVGNHLLDDDQEDLMRSTIVVGTISYRVQAIVVDVTRSESDESGASEHIVS